MWSSIQEVNNLLWYTFPLIEMWTLLWVWRFWRHNTRLLKLVALLWVVKRMGRWNIKAMSEILKGWNKICYCNALSYWRNRAWRQEGSALFLARSTKTYARRKECVINEINAKNSQTLEADLKITILARQNPHSKLSVRRNNNRHAFE